MRSILHSADNATRSKDSLRSTIGGTLLEPSPIDSILIRNEQLERMNRKYTVQHLPNVSKTITGSFPCPFLRFVSATRDLEHLKFQLDVNHCDNDRRDQIEESKETLG